MYAIQATKLCHIAGVLIWLGEEADDSDLAIEGLRRQGAIYNSFKRTLKIPKNLLRWREEFDGKWQALCQRQYWSRLWIVQEIMLARDIEIFCGTKSLDWNTFIEFAHIGALRYAEGETFDSIFSPKLFPIAWLVQMCHLHDTDVRDILNLFYGTCHLKCMDPRDRVFGLLSMVEAEADQLPTVDYTKSLVVIYYEMMAYFLKHDNYRRRDLDSILSFSVDLQAGWTAANLNSHSSEIPQQMYLERFGVYVVPQDVITRVGPLVLLECPGDEVEATWTVLTEEDTQYPAELDVPRVEDNISNLDFIRRINATRNAGPIPNEYAAELQNLFRIFVVEDHLFLGPFDVWLGDILCTSRNFLPEIKYDESSRPLPLWQVPYILFRELDNEFVLSGEAVRYRSLPIPLDGQPRDDNDLAAKSRSKYLSPQSLLSLTW
jgi:hypothetical protein